ncbi:hypothetical protein CDAR_267491 [Caerostris darwini]|uniref:Uncharacterized protein n=1 Tax=Caerostris darwini TaxID=1538125 RepID=A0AAV4TII1_9ARAC|nr:hypothetical protein CDAR_267491 [Caerostris darwini]
MESMFRISNCLALSLSDSIQIRFRLYRRVRLAQIKKTGQRHSWAGFDQKLSATIFPCSTPGRGGKRETKFVWANGQQETIGFFGSKIAFVGKFNTWGASVCWGRFRYLLCLLNGVEIWFGLPSKKKSLWLFGSGFGDAGMDKMGSLLFWFGFGRYWMDVRVGGIQVEKIWHD